ncbi:MAG: glycine cleavage system protein GcvH [Dethiobacteria bacterium]|nr:glycine cleavage system protein GcvH [Bacillota bacterium]HOJ85008.1 glycine cleavage system protein GcvH [Bacillota bacterium]HOL16474.1 glycine cleavage system protein GcvH [Bacillota bacterium]
MNWQIRSGLKYTRTHEWVSFDGGLATVGITDYAQDMLKDIVYVELPETGQEAKSGERLVVLESVKAVSDLYAPVDGEVVEINEALQDQPELLNEDPYGEAWVVKIRVAPGYENPELLDEDEYAALLKEEAEK